MAPSSPPPCSPAERQPPAIRRSGAGSPASSAGASARAAAARWSQALLFGELNKPFKPARTPFDWLSRDNAEVDKYIADPLCGFESTKQLAIDLLGGAARPRLAASAARIPKGLPIYIFSGSRDPVGAKLKGLIDVYRAAGLNVTTKIYPDARHETLNETNREEVTADLVAWLDANVR